MARTASRRHARTGEGRREQEAADADVVISGPDPGTVNPNAAPSWQEYLGDNVGNGFWTEPVSASLDVPGPVDPPVDSPVPPGDLTQRLTPSDYPEQYVVRRWTLEFGGDSVQQTPGHVTLFETIEEARGSLPEGAYLVQGRGQDPDPVVVEVWM